MLGTALAAAGGVIWLAGCGVSRPQPSAKPGTTGGAAGTKGGAGGTAGGAVGATGETSGTTSGAAGTSTTRAVSGTGGAAPAGRAVGVLYMAILSGGMAGKKGWPLFVPADFTVPAGSTMPVEIRCFDNGAAPVSAAYTRVTGTVGGTITVLSQISGNLAAASPQSVSSLAANKIAHTFTVTALGLNVPIPPLSTVRFHFHTGGAGSRVWQCMAACSTGANGTSGAMAADGWMRGTMLVKT